MVTEMCRMISFVSVRSVKVKEYFDALIEQALHGSYSPHGDGWGMALYEDDEFLLKKNSEAIWQASIISNEAKIAILHARKTTDGKVKTSSSHPFFFSLKGKDWSFAHNGSIKIPLKNDIIDTQFYLESLVHHMIKGETLQDAMRKVAEEITKYEYTSLNVFISNGEELFAFRKVSNDDDDYHSIFYRVEEDRVVFSTERFGDGWKALKNNEFARARSDGTKVLFKTEGW